MISYLWTDGNNKDFQSFYQKTEEYYSKIAGGLENRKDFVPYNISDTIEVVLIAFIDNKAIACAGLKRYSDTDAEIKRVWVEPEFRGNHISADMMDLLEKKALEQGFKRTILQTRPQMESAIHIYTMLGYEQQGSGSSPGFFLLQKNNCKPKTLMSDRRIGPASFFYAQKYKKKARKQNGF